MTNESKARIATTLLVAAVVGFGIWKKSGGTRAPAADQPQDAVYAMLDAAHSGDVKRYLAAHSGSMEASLRQVMSESSERDFATYLRNSNAALKGVAISDAQIDGTTAALRVEYVYQDRNETQTMYLEKGAAGWKIFRTDSDQRVKTLVPYGTPVKAIR